MPGTTTDKYANMAVITNLESAANTFTAKKLETGISLFDKVAWLISRIEYFILNLDATQFNGTGDYLHFGLLVADSADGLDLRSQLCVDFNKVQRLDMGTAGNGEWRFWPIVKDFSTIQGGGLLVPPNPLYLAQIGAGLAAASNLYARLFYTVVELKAEEYWELVEARRVIVS